MALEYAAASREPQPRGAGPDGPLDPPHEAREEPGEAQLEAPATDEANAAPPPAPDPEPDEQPELRAARIQLNAVKDEFRRAELAFVTAKRVLGDPAAGEAAGRIADALSRASRAVDTIEKGVAVHPVLNALVDVARFDPAWEPVEFCETAGRSVADVGRKMERCEFATVAYWGRTLARLATAFASRKEALVV
jgi:hypothetical protein